MIAKSKESEKEQQLLQSKRAIKIEKIWTKE
jgi:hypothetical protein